MALDVAEGSTACPTARPTRTRALSKLPSAHQRPSSASLRHWRFTASPISCRVAFGLPLELVSGSQEPHIQRSEPFGPANPISPKVSRSTGWVERRSGCRRFPRRSPTHSGIGASSIDRSPSKLSMPQSNSTRRRRQRLPKPRGISVLGTRYTSTLTQVPHFPANPCQNWAILLIPDR